MDSKNDRRTFLTTVSGGMAIAAAMSRGTAQGSPQSASRATTSNQDDICFMSARDLATLIRTRKLSVREVMAAHLERINRVNPKVNAIVARLDERQCLALADAADKRSTKKEELGPLHGLPIAFKDLQPAVGFPFTRGSTIYRDAMPAEDSVLVERLRKAGAIPIGKTNTPEFGMGSHTYNKVYGTTVNPFDYHEECGRFERRCRCRPCERNASYRRWQ